MKNEDVLGEVEGLAPAGARGKKTSAGAWDVSNCQEDSTARCREGRTRRE